MTELVLHDSPHTDTELPLLKLNVEQLNNRLNALSLEILAINSSVGDARRSLEERPAVAAVVQRIRETEQKIHELAVLRHRAKQKFKDSMKAYDEGSDDIGSKDIPLIDATGVEDSGKGDDEPTESEAVKSKFKAQREAEKLAKEVRVLGRKLRKLTHPDTQKDKEIASFFFSVTEAIKHKNLGVLQDLYKTISALVVSNQSAKERKRRIAEYLVKLRFKVSEVTEEMKLTKQSVPYVLAQLVEKGNIYQAEALYVKSLETVEKTLKDHLEALTARTRVVTKMAETT